MTKTGKTVAVAISFLLIIIMCFSECVTAAVKTPSKVCRTAVRTHYQNAVMAWTKSRGAAKYQIQVKLPNGKIRSFYTKSRRYRVAGGKTGKYIFRVRGLVGRNAGKWSGIRRFILKKQLVFNSKACYQGFSCIPDFAKRYRVIGGNIIQTGAKTGKYGTVNYTVVSELTGYSYATVTKKQINEYTKALKNKGFAYNSTYKAYILARTEDSTKMYYVLTTSTKEKNVNGTNTYFTVNAKKICNIINDKNLL